MSDIHLLTGRSHPAFAKKISRQLKIPLTQIDIHDFANGEIYARILKKVRGDDVYLIQSLCSPVNQNLVETLIIIDALKRASVGRINLICPFLAYCRQDRKAKSREPITAKLVADLITQAGASRLVSVDFHTDQIQAYYNIPVDHFVAYPQFAKYIVENNLKNVVIVSPDIGGLKRANKLADLLGLQIAVIDKVRKAHNKSEVAHVVGNVKDKTAVIIDDIIDTGGSIVSAAQEIKKRGAKKIIICATHAVLSKDAKNKLCASCVDKIILTDTIPLSSGLKKDPKFEIISLAPLMAKVIKRIHTGRSLGELFTWEDKQTNL